jgi:predicted nucleic-acid-binding protein
MGVREGSGHGYIHHHIEGPNHSPRRYSGERACRTGYAARLVGDARWHHHHSHQEHIQPGPASASLTSAAVPFVAEGQSLFVPVTVTLELEWVLRARYEVGKEDVLRVLSNLFSAAELSFESERALEVALHLYRDGPADFADCLHIALAAEAGEQPLWTFDKGAARVAGARAIRVRQGKLAGKLTHETLLKGGINCIICP